MFDIITDKLNSPQKEAVLHMDGPLLILAGAGSGKTRVLTHRMAHLIAQGAAAADDILCVTFTNKAAREMESRIYQILNDLHIPIRSQLWISTFHSFCVRVLRQHITLLGYKPFFSIYDPSDQLSQIKKVMSALNVNDKIFPAKSFQSRISSAKMMGLSPSDIERSSGPSLMDTRSLQIYRQYEQEMRKANALDFDDLLLKTWELFFQHPEILHGYQDKFRYIMIDEYQDTNRIQYLLIQALAKAHRNLCVVGDEDQSIYSWRGADIRNILDFEKDFPEAKIVKLEENYRSSGNIVDAATAVIRHNSQRKDKTLFTSNAKGDLIRVHEEKNEYDEARFVAKTVQQALIQAEHMPQDVAIFYRTNAQSRVLEEQLRTLGIAYRIVGGVRFYERLEIKDVLSYMKLSLNPADDAAFKRVINTPARGIGKTTVEKIEGLATAENLTLLKATENAVLGRVFNAGTTSKLRRFIDLQSELQQNAQQFSLPEFYHIVLDRTGYLAALKAEDTPEAEARIENLEELDNAIEQFVRERGEDAHLQGFLEEMALVSDQDALKDEIQAVTLMTLHISKGLEFPLVFIVGLEDGLFPSARGGFDSESEDDLEEERRLAYVGMTRARQKLYLTYAKMRRVWGQEQTNPPSRFLKEIPKNLIEMTSAAATSGFVSRMMNHASSNRPTPSKMDFDAQDFPDYDGQENGYQRGMRVRHPTFGAGSVYSTEGSGENLKVSVVFSDQTIKKFVVKYARLEKI